MECASRPAACGAGRGDAYGLVEDMEYSWTLRVAGEKIRSSPASRVYGAMLGSGGTAAANQRRRWEFGRSEIRRKYLGPLLRSHRTRLVGEALLSLRDDHPHDGVRCGIYVVLWRWTAHRGCVVCAIGRLRVFGAAFLWVACSRSS